MSVRKRSSRFMAGLPSTVHTPLGDVACEAFNLSRTGVLLEGPLDGASGNRWEVTLRSVAGDLIVRLTGVVQRIEPGEPPHVALKLDPPRASDRQTFEALIARVVEGLNPAPLAQLSPGSSPAEIKLALEKVPLAHRVALAKRAASQDRGFLRHDGNPRVLEALLRNPNATAQEVFDILKTPDLLPVALDAVARDARWAKDDDILLRVATHSRASMQTAQRLMEGFSPVLRQKALASPGLNAAVRAKFAPRFGR